MSKDMVHSPEAGLIPTEGLAALISRLEAAEAGSRELDCDIYEWRGYRVRRAPKPKGVNYSGFSNQTVGWRYLNCSSWCAIPPVTTSLDAALALAERVLPGVFWNVGTCSTDEPHRYSADLSCDGSEYSAATPALALCIAILKAKTATQ